MKPLISISDLMSFGFTAIKETWKPTLKYSIWFFILPLAYYLLLTVAGLAGAVGSRGMGPGPAFWLVYFVGMAVMVLGLIWAAIGLFQYMLAYTHGQNMKTWKPKRAALSYLPGLLWIAVLSALPAIGSMIIVALPMLLARRTAAGILLSLVLFLIAIPFLAWIGTLFSQAQILLLNDEARGLEAIRKSIDLVQKRWGAVFARIFVPVILFVLIVMVIQMVLVFVGIILFVSLLGGWAAFAGVASQGREGLEALRGAGVGFGLVSILILLAYGVFAFVVAIATRIAQLLFQTSVSAKLFHSLKESK
ncbi:MAG TPA: hypothetical protein VMU11_01285 [Verrucomicrobiae bacterium]|nr:hypothetical protein [Verrucomicrobiae bacterium]